MTPAPWWWIAVVCLLGVAVIALCARGDRG